VPGTVADSIEKRLDWAIAREGGIPLDDPLRFDDNGHRLTQEHFNRKLDWIIQLWPTYKGEWKRGRSSNNKSRL
jgi:hypothetical protein